MSPERTSRGGTLRFDLILPGVGRVRRSSGTNRLGEFRRREAVLRSLVERGRIDLIRAWLEKQVSLVTLLEWHQTTLPDRETAALAEPWAAAVARALPRMGKRETSRTSYRIKLARIAEVMGFTRVGDMVGVDWPAARGRFHGPTNWNHVARTLSAFATVIGGPALRGRVLAGFMKEEEVEHVPDHDQASFDAVCAALPEPSAMLARVLVYVGARRGEWWGGATLRPTTRELVLRGKGAKPRSLVIDERVWPAVAAYVPCPIPYRTFAQQLEKACARVGVPHLRVHDLRHLCGQWMADAHVPEPHIGAWLGHTTAHMTRKYTRRRLRAADATTLVSVVAPHFLPQSLAPVAPVRLVKEA